MRSLLIIAFGVASIATPAAAKGILHEEAVAVGMMQTATSECMDTVPTAAADILADVVFSFAQEDSTLLDLVFQGNDLLNYQIKTEGREFACKQVMRRYPDLLKIQASAEIK